MQLWHMHYLTKINKWKQTPLSTKMNRHNSEWVYRSPHQNVKCSAMDLFSCFCMFVISWCCFALHSIGSILHQCHVYVQEACFFCAKLPPTKNPCCAAGHCPNLSYSIQSAGDRCILVINPYMYSIKKCVWFICILNSNRKNKAWN